MSTLSPPRPGPLRPSGTARPQAGDEGPGPPGQPAHPSALADPDAPLLLLATLALCIAACLPLARVFVGLDFLRPVVAAVLLAFSVSWGVRRLGGGPIVTLALSTLAWLGFSAFAFLDQTLYAGVIPTPATLAELRALWTVGLELIRLRPAPAFAEAGLLLVTVTGVWAVVHSVEGLVFRVLAPVKAIAMALILWVVPLAIAPSTTRAWVWTVPFLAAAAALMLAFAGQDLLRWGTWVPEVRARGGHMAPSPRDPGAAGRAALLPSGSAVAAAAILAGVLLAGTLPGFGDAPWYELRGLGGSRLTSNPIVEIRSRLVNNDPTPLLQVQTQRPVYLRVTGLDVYSDREEWTLEGIAASPVDGPVQGDAIASPLPLTVGITVAGLPPETLLVPAPYQPATFAGPAASVFQYDPDTATITLDSDAELAAGDAYEVTAQIPSPTAEALQTVEVRSANLAPLVALPSSVPQSVHDLAREIVASAGATTAFEQALAIQDRLRGWTYSLEPQSGHGATAMESFITNQVGYCEQFAGTMAVMLRSLGIPTRVAVGYTPGEQLPDGTWEVTGANAHAWVEVLFPGQGWIAFEPTPRSDDNLLVPSATNLAPNLLASGPQVPPEPIENVEPDLNPEQNPGAVDDIPEFDPDPAAGGGSEEGGLPWPVILAGVIALAGVAAVLGVRTRTVALAPHDRVLAARRRVATVGRGLGRSSAPAETDREYLTRLAPGHPDAGTLATVTDRARWAPTLPPGAADRAERAADGLVTHLLGGLHPLRRVAVRARGAVGTLWSRRPRGRATQLLSRPTQLLSRSDSPRRRSSR